jgi:hypothetical protein
MNCPFCNTVNDDENTFCVSCGKTISQNAKTEVNFMPPTQDYATSQYEVPDTESVETAYPPRSFPNQPPPNQPISNQPPPSYNANIPNIGATQPTPKSGRGFLYAFLGLLAVLVIGGAGFAGFYFWQNQPSAPEKTEILPDHLGLFVQNKGKDKLTEVKKRDIANALDEKEKIAEDEDLPVWENEAGLILYSDSNEISSTNLKLIPVDSIEKDGTIKELEFQVSPIDENPAMKRLRVADGIANGKYVFALLDGYLDDGKHKLWAFQVTGSDKENNDDIARSKTLEMKESSSDKSEKPVEKTEDTAKITPPKKTPVPKKEPPTGSVVAYCNGSNVVLRGSPSLKGKKIGGLSRGQRLYVLKYSGNYDDWQGTTANWAYIQTESGNRGWVFTPFVSY